LTSSDVDWGQDLFHLKRWLTEHDITDPIGFSYSVPIVDPMIVGIKWTAIPPGADAAVEHRWGLADDKIGPQPGLFAITATHIYERRKEYRYFLRFKPIATAGYSTYIYRITLADANRVRREYQLPLLANDRS
jgi:hypothetical protein